MEERRDLFFYKLLSEADERGNIPTDRDRSEEAYLYRIEQIFKICAEKESDFLPDEYMRRMESFLNAHLSSIPVLISKKNLALWEMACCWIEEDTISIQLHPNLIAYPESSWRLSSYAIILHEYVHALRAPLLSSKYEEYIAYSVSNAVSSGWKSSFRNFFGPLFESPQEISLFFTLFLALFFILSILLDMGLGIGLISTCWALLLFPFICRLIVKQKRIDIVIDALQRSISPLKSIWPLFIRLSDADIDDIVQESKKGRFSLTSYRVADWRWCYYRKKYGE